GAVGPRRFEAPQQLVLPLGAGLEEGDLAVDAALDAGVAGGLEVEEGHVVGGAPVAAVEGGRGLEEEGAGDRLAAAASHGHLHPRRRELAEVLEEAGPEVVVAAVLGDRPAVEAVEGGDLGRPEVAAADEGEIV